MLCIILSCITEQNWKECLKIYTNMLVLLKTGNEEACNGTMLIANFMNTNHSVAVIFMDSQEQSRPCA
jgi:hypothetical protein